MLTPWKESYDQPRQHIKKQRHYLVNKDQSSQGYGFFSGHVQMWELDYEESWAQKYRCFWTVVLDKTLESPLDCKEIQPVHPKGYQSWVFIGRIDAEAETPILWPSDVKSWLTGKDPNAGKDWGQEEKQTTENEMVGWHHRLNGHEFGWTPGVGDGQGGLACCSTRGRKESDMTERLNWTELTKSCDFMAQQEKHVRQAEITNYRSQSWAQFSFPRTEMISSLPGACPYPRSVSQYMGWEALVNMESKSSGKVLVQMLFPSTTSYVTLASYLISRCFSFL